MAYSFRSAEPSDAEPPRTFSCADAGTERGGFEQAYDPALGVPETVRSEFADGERGGVSLGFGRRGQEFAELGVGDSIEI